MANWLFWRKRKRDQDKVCGAWDPPDGSYGRDTHICNRPRHHEELAHRCKCGTEWIVG